MKAQLLKISNPAEYTFSVRHDVTPVFHNRWHYHPEIEIIMIRKGDGTSLIGDSLAHFEANDVFILGSNLPHLFRYDFLEDDDFSDAYVIHFLPTFFGSDFLGYPEMKAIKDLILKANRGIHIRPANADKIFKIFDQLQFSKGVNRVIDFLHILSVLIEEESLMLLSSIGFTNKYDRIDSERLDKIYNHVFSNFDREISLEEIANIASLSVNSFCRYFKSKTNKTFSNFLLEVRIGRACKLLFETDLSISQVCFESGFNNLSNFNRYFKKFMNKTPSQYLEDVKSGILVKL